MKEVNNDYIRILARNGKMIYIIQKKNWRENITKPSNIQRTKENIQTFCRKL